MLSLREVLSAEPAPGTVVDRVAVLTHGAVGVVTLSEPAQRNALSLAAWRRIAEAFEMLGSDAQVRVVVLRGAGEHFGAGADIKEFPTTRMDPHQAAAYNAAIATAIRAVAAIEVPVVALLRGMVVGGGLELASAADTRIADESVQLGLPIGRLGVGLGLSETRSLLRLIGPAALKHLVFSGRLIGAQRAREMGLLQEVYAATDLIDEATALLEAISAASLPTLRSVKTVVEIAQRSVTDADTEALIRHTVDIYSGADLAEGVAAFSERRPVVFPSTIAPQETVR